MFGSAAQDINIAFSHIAQGKSVRAPTYTPGMPQGLRASCEIGLLTIDSGACDSIIPPPGMFKNTPLSRPSDQGRTYGACGGEAVINLGCKNAKCITHDGIHTLPFQVGDRITRGLLAVSQLASLGAGIWLGPAPEYKSYIVWGKNAFIAAAGPKQ